MTADFHVRSDSVDVEQIMRQIRSRIREKRGADYTEEEIKALAGAKLEKFLDPSGVRSDLIEHFRRARQATHETADASKVFVPEESILFESGNPMLRFARNLLRPVLRLFMNYNRLSQVLHEHAVVTAQFNAHQERQRAIDNLHFEVMHNLVLETTRLGIEVRNLKMRLESISSRLDFDERRARALEGVVQYRPGVLDAAPAPAPAASSSTQPSSSQPSHQGGQPVASGDAAGLQERRARRRRRRGRRRHGAQGAQGGQGAQGAQGTPGAQGAQGAQSAEAAENAPEHHEHEEHLEHDEHPEHGGHSGEQDES